MITNKHHLAEAQLSTPSRQVILWLTSHLPKAELRLYSQRNFLMPGSKFQVPTNHPSLLLSYSTYQLTINNVAVQTYADHMTLFMRHNAVLPNRTP